MARRKSTANTTDNPANTTDNPAKENNMDTKSGQRAGLPTFEVIFMDELPASDRKRGAGRGPSRAYHDALVRIRDEGNGAWGSVAFFQTPTGAATALRQIRAGQKIVPEDIDRFEFQTRRLTDETGKRTSVLFARYVG